MTKEEIQRRLRDNHKNFTELILSLNDRDFLLSANGKWTAGQQLDHICRSVTALDQGLKLPKFIIKLILGKANRPSKDYEGLVAKYKLRLAQGGTAAGRFVPKPVGSDQKTIGTEKLLNTIDSLCKKIDEYSEEQLDYYILPHPLLGKLTLREMLYFTIYHVEHHQQLTRRNLGQSNLPVPGL
ncbi:MAG: DinB family protein [Bacteroidota bacterium]|nr:DinB family protein [Bacteroidota bacterium]